ncbi:MAG: hypothetical protein HPY76_15125 [Anaerolineae bacterium]|nr:hypothetical protein [Anaerolineae bacterium]
MKRVWLLSLGVIILLLAACTPAATPPVAEVVETEAAPVEEELTVLEIIGIDGTSEELTMSDIQAMEPDEGYAGIKSSTGEITPPATFKGVSLIRLAELVGPMEEGTGVNVVASDGYSITFSYNQLMNGDFIAYDPGTGDEKQEKPVLTPILAYEVDGADLDENRDGELRVAIISDEKNQVTDGHWSVKWVSKIEVRELTADWTVLLEGAINEEMDRATFESGAAPNCHQTIWVDEKNQEWIGIPLWLMVGRVDDEIKHDGPAFNDDLADAGYTVEVVAADGYSATFDSTRVKRNDNIIVAYLVNENPLDEDVFPLKLVGSDVSKKEAVGAIAEIKINFEGAVAEPTAEPTEAVVEEVTGPTLEGDLVIFGKVGEEMAFSVEDLKAIGDDTYTLEHPKKGAVDYNGVKVNDLLAMVAPAADATTMVLTASDGFSAEVDLSSLAGCDTCIIAFTDDGLMSALPGQESSAWVKFLSKIEIK